MMAGVFRALSPARWAAPLARRLVAPAFAQPFASRRALSNAPILPRESLILRQLREAKDGQPLAHVPGSPFGGEVVIKRIDRFGRRRIKGKRGMSKRVIWMKQIMKHFYDNMSTKKLHRIVRTAIRANQGFTQALYFQLESRLDMFLRRCFLAPSLASARQAVNHRFVLVNGRTAISASQQLNYGDVVQIDQSALAKTRKTLLAVRARAARAPCPHNAGPRRTRLMRRAHPSLLLPPSAAPRRAHTPVWTRPSAGERVAERSPAVRPLPAATIVGNALLRGLGHAPPQIQRRGGGRLRRARGRAKPRRQLGELRPCGASTSRAQGRVRVHACGHLREAPNFLTTVLFA
jgi:ribosomal protein S4